MDISTLKQYYLIEGEIRNEEEKIAKIEAKLCASPGFDKNGVPKSPTPRNRVEETYIELIARKEELHRKVAEYKEMKASIERYIDDIDDLLIRRIAEERFVNNKRFREIADELGGRNTAESVRKMLNRYIQSNKE